jgi:3-deoxy-D-manno-octulosonic-acid transferase
MPFYLFGLLKSNKDAPAIGERWKEYFGYTPALAKDESPLWVHAVSVGEVIAVAPLIKALYQSTTKPILVTTTTTTGAEQVNKLLANEVEHRFMPLDSPWAIKRFLNAIKPEKLLIMETELWPNTLRLVHKSNIPISVVNARLSHRSFKRYLKVRSLFTLISKYLTHVICQNESDAKRFSQLGVDDKKIYISGSIKFDIHIDNSLKILGNELRSTLGGGREVWVAASTHSGEEEQILEAHSKILMTHPDSLLLLVPRHPQRFSEVDRLCRASGFETSRRSLNEQVSEKTTVYLCDTMGELLTLISAADLCFIGGSLVGKKVGGHNVLEPVSLDVATIIGPSYFNFKDIVESLEARQGILLCQGSESLSKAVSLLFDQDAQRRKLAQNASLVLSEGRGAINRTLDIVTAKSAASNDGI